VPAFAGQNSVGLSIARLIGNGGNLPKERYQEPTLQQTTRGVWFIRPWVDIVTPQGVTRNKKTISIGAMGKREAQARVREIMRDINRADYVITSQINFGKFLEEYLTLHVSQQSSNTQAKYKSLIKNHIRPAFEKLSLCELEPMTVQKWLDAKATAQSGTGLSWATRTDIRNILSSIFTKAIEWDRWKAQNPIERVHVGRKRAVREKRKLTDEQTRRLMAALPFDLRVACCVGLFCTLRVSETLGLQEKHLDFERGLILVRQRWSRGNLDAPKNDNATRDVPMGYLAADLKTLCLGDPERFVFQIKTHRERKVPTICRDDRDLNQHFIRPAAKALGFYWKGFGWHAFRREAITAIGSVLGIGQAMKMAGHSDAAQSILYTLADQQAQDGAIRARQESIIGKAGEKVN
jgi:integrase